jgi:hypothetical protein
MRSKFGKEKTLFKTEKFRVKYGTIDAIKLNAIYINIESWIEPQKIVNFESNIRLTRTKIIQNIKQMDCFDLFSKNLIVDLDLRSSGMCLGKKSFMYIQITLFPQTQIKFNSPELLAQITQIANRTIETINMNEYHFSSKK